MVLEDGILKKVKDKTKADSPRQLVIPTALRRGVMALCHDCSIAGHMGAQATLHRVKEKYWWRRMKDDVYKYVHSYDICQSKKHRTTKPPGEMESIIATKPFEFCGIDFVGPLPATRKGNKYIITFRDKFTGWCELAAVPDQSAKTAAEFFVKQVFLRHGAPGTLVSDKGAAFLATLLKEINEILQVRRVTTSGYHRSLLNRS